MRVYRLVPDPAKLVRPSPFLLRTCAPALTMLVSPRCAGITRAQASRVGSTTTLKSGAIGSLSAMAAQVRDSSNFNVVVIKL